MGTAGFVVLLTTLTFFSTPILEAIFGNGMVEGEDPDAWWKEIEPRTSPNPAEDELEDVGEHMEESFQMEALEALATESNQVNIEAQVIRGEDEKKETEV